MTTSGSVAIKTNGSAKTAPGEKKAKEKLKMDFDGRSPLFEGRTSQHCYGYRNNSRVEIFGGKTVCMYVCESVSTYVCM